MKLEIGRIFVKDVVFSEESGFENGILYLKKQEVINEVLTVSNIRNCDIDLAKPGESVRIIPVKDVIEPRVKVEGPRNLFPGLIGEPTTVGFGRTHAFKGIAVVTVGSIVSFQEGLIDMSGPGAVYSPFSRTINIVVICEPVAGLTPQEHETAVRLAGLKAAVKIGELAKTIEPDEVITYSLERGEKPWKILPKIGYINTILAQGLLHDNYIYGTDAKKCFPTIIHPNEFMDGAVVSGNCVTACDKNTTYDYLNHPIVEELYEKHKNGELDFGGVILCPVTPKLSEKEKFTSYSAKLAKMLGLDGVIISQEGGGNPETDTMLLCKKCEEMGVKTVVMTHENSGELGDSDPLTYFVPEADAIVTMGNTNIKITLPPMDKIIGDIKTVEKLSGSLKNALKEDGSIGVMLDAIVGSINNFGVSKMTTRLY